MLSQGDDVKAVEDMQPLGAVFADQLKIGFPHVGTDEYEFGNYFLAHSGEESLEGFDGSLFAYPEKAGNAQIDLVDTLSQDVRKASAVSFHDTRRAQRARKSM